MRAAPITDEGNPDIYNRLRRMATAFHEAGHAVVGQHFGSVVKYATIELPGPMDGYVEFSGADEPSDGIDQICHGIITTMAGMVAERRCSREVGTEVDGALYKLPLSQEQLDEGAAVDYAALEEIRAILGDAGYEKLVAWGKRSAAWYVGRHWDEIACFAARLYEEGTVYLG